MKQLKDRLFEVLAGSIEALDFEKWLYEQQELMDIIDSNAFVYRVVCLDYKNLEVVAIDRICESIGDEEAYLISKIERGCRQILNCSKPMEVLNIINEIGNNYSFDTDFRLSYEFYHFENGLFANNSYKPYGENRLLENAKYLAKCVLVQLDSVPLVEKRELLITGFPETFEYPENLKTKWYDFLKKETDKNGKHEIY